VTSTTGEELEVEEEAVGSSRVMVTEYIEAFPELATVIIGSLNVPAINTFLLVDTNATSFDNGRTRTPKL
jgi:hypothetical protein